LCQKSPKAALSPLLAEFWRSFGRVSAEFWQTFGNASLVSAEFRQSFGTQKSVMAELWRCFGTLLANKGQPNASKTRGSIENIQHSTFNIQRFLFLPGSESSWVSEYNINPLSNACMLTT
jgi:hypothetical protein